MPIKVGVGGVQRQLSDIRAGVGGVNRKLTSMKCGVSGANRELLVEPPKPATISVVSAEYEWTDAAQVNTGDFYQNGTGTAVTIGSYIGQPAIVSKLPYALNGGRYRLKIRDAANFVGRVTLYAEMQGAYFDGTIGVRSLYGNQSFSLEQGNVGGYMTFEVPQTSGPFDLYELTWYFSYTEENRPIYIWIECNGLPVTIY